MAESINANRPEPSVEEEEEIIIEEQVRRLKQLEEDNRRQMLKSSIPFREYMIQHILPCLTLGIIETVIQHPDDPINFLAQFLYKKNTNGHMFNPSMDHEKMLEISNRQLGDPEEYSID